MVFAWLQRILPSWLVYGGQTASTPPATSKDSDALPDDVMTSPSWAWDLKGSQRAYDPATAQRLELAFAAGEDIVDLDQGFFASRPGQYRVLLKAGRQLNTVTQ